jgi:hypothetical protein
VEKTDGKFLKMPKEKKVQPDPRFAKAMKEAVREAVFVARTFGTDLAFGGKNGKVEMISPKRVGGSIR